MTATSAVEDQIATVAQVQSQMDAIARTLSEQTDALASCLRHLALHLLHDDEKPPQQLIHRLYWESPSLHVSEIYQAFGLRGATDVAAVAGPHDLHVPCRDCGELRTFRVKSRTQMRGLPAKHPRCDACADRWEREQEPKRAADAARRTVERRLEAEELSQAMEAYVLAHPDLPDVPEADSMYVGLTGARHGGATVTLSALLAVRDQLRVRLQSVT